MPDPSPPPPSLRLRASKTPFSSRTPMGPARLFGIGLRVLLAAALLATGACSDQPWTWVALDDSPRGTPVDITVNDQISDASLTEVSVAIHGYWKRPRFGTDQLFYTEIRVPGLAPQPVLGAPSVPVLKLSIAIPNDRTNGQAVLETLVEERETIETELAKLWPVIIGETDQNVPDAPANPRGAATYEQFVVDPAYYNAQAEPWPSQGALLEARNEVRLRSIPSAEITLSPIRWRPQDKVLEVVSKMIVTVKHPVDPQLAPAITPERKKMAGLEFVNFEQVESYFPLADFYNAEYLIIYPNASYADEVLPLADQKRARGYRVSEMRTSEIGNTCELIRAAIQTWEILRPRWSDAYVLLIGDTDTIPLCTSPTGDPTDDLYASTNGDDLNEEVFLGRLSVDSESDLAAQINKILTYEDDPSFFCCYDQAALWAHKEGAPGKYQGAHETVRTNTYTTPPVFTTYYGSVVGVDDADIQNEVDNGVGVLAYRGHGDEDATATGWDQSSNFFNSRDVAALVNPIRNSPVTWAFACSNSALDTDDSIAEIWMEQPDTASVSYYGATVPSFTSENHVLDEWMFRAVYDEGLTKQSHAIRRAENQTSALSGSSNAWMYLLLGDPDMDIRRRNPSQYLVLKPSVLNICSLDSCLVEFIVTDEFHVPLPDLRIALWKQDPIGLSDGEIFNNGYTDTTGRVQLLAQTLSEGQLHFSLHSPDGGSVTGVIPVVDNTRSAANRSSEPQSEHPRDAYEIESMRF